MLYRYMEYKVRSNMLYVDSEWHALLRPGGNVDGPAQDPHFTPLSAAASNPFHLGGSKFDQIRSTSVDVSGQTPTSVDPDTTRTPKPHIFVHTNRGGFFLLVGTEPKIEICGTRESKNEHLKNQDAWWNPKSYIVDKRGLSLCFAIGIHLLYPPC